MSVVIASILETICESHYFFRVVHDPTSPLEFEPAPNPADYKPPDPACPSLQRENNYTISKEYPVTEAHPVLDVIDDICVVSLPKSAASVAKLPAPTVGHGI